MRPLKQSEVTPPLVAWAQSLSNDGTVPIGYVEDRRFGDRVIQARVVWHDYQARTGTHGRFHACELWTSDAPLAPHDADFSPTTPVAEGVDLSRFQAGADLARVAQAGKSFAIAKVSEGITLADASYKAHVTGARAAGLLVGCYHFLRVSSDPRAQVRRFVELAGTVDLPHSLDVESQALKRQPTVVDMLGGLSPSAFGDHAVTALQELAEQIKRRPLLYVSPGFWALLPASHRKELAAVADLWQAQYSTATPSPPAEFQRWAFWQYTDHATVAGYPGAADANRFCGTVAQLQAYARTGRLPAVHDAPPDLSTWLGVQKALNRLGASPRLDEDNIPGPVTYAALDRFQREHGLKVDHDPGPKTRAALTAALAPDTDPNPPMAA